MTHEPPAGAARFLIVVVESLEQSDLGREFGVVSDRAVIGRGEECEVSLADTAVSRRHAEITVEGGGLRLVDRGSANGLWIDEERVDSARVGPGDTFRIGTTVLKVLAAPAPATAPDDVGVEQSAGSVAASPAAHAGEGLQAAAWLPEAEHVPTRGNQPILLDQLDVAWIVDSGRVEIFIVAVEDGRPAGARTHYLTIEAGEAFFGMDLLRYGRGIALQAVGKMGTSLARVSVPRLRSLAANPARRERIARLVDRWVEGLSQALTREILPGPRADVELAENGDIALDQDQTARPSQGVLWLGAEHETLLFLSMAPITISTQQLFPLAASAWIDAGGETRSRAPLRASSASAAVEQPALWRGLDEFHRAVCECEFINQRLAVVDELDRLKSRTAYAAAAGTAALRSLASVVDHQSGELPKLAREEQSKALFPTMKLVAESQRIALRDEPEPEQEPSPGDPMARIARASGIRLRRVALRSAWWTRDHGPMIGTRTSGAEPVALLPRGNHAYDLVDLKRQTRVRVDEEASSQLDGFAYVLYRPFPPGKLTATDLFRFGASGRSRELLLVAGLGVSVGLLAVLTPALIGRTFDSAIPEAETSLLRQFVFALAAAALCSTAFRVMQNLVVVRLQTHMEHSIQTALWDRLLLLPSTFFRSYSAGDLADRVAGINAIRDLAAGSSVAALLGGLSSPFYFLLMFWYSVPLALLAVGLTVLFVGFTSAADVLQLRHQRSELMLRGAISGLVLQLISGVGKLRVAGAEESAFQAWADQFARQRRIRFKIGQIQNQVAVFLAGFPIVSSMALFGVVALVYLRSQRAGLPGPLSTGQFIGFSAAYGLFVAAAQALADASLDLLRAVPFYERLRPIVTTTPEVDETKAHPGRLRGELELSRVHFRYQEDGPWILRDVSLKIEPGKFVAFVGNSGCGKSTLMRLLVGLEKPGKGGVYYDGQDLGSLDLGELRRQLGVVLQESQVLPADIYRNIVGTSSRSLEEAWEAARMAGLDQDIRQMPMGMHTQVSEGGGTLSGGQRQRLLIARALVRKPRIVFMDEATSALDNRAQAVVTESLDRLQATRIVIAHRLSTIIHADLICYLEDGEIREQGTYQELMQLNGRFAELATRQLA